MTGPQDILGFWFGADLAAWQPRWFRPAPEFDAAIRDRFGAMVVPAREGAFDSWAT